MNVRDLLFWIYVAYLYPAAAGGINRPHIILLMADDMGWNDVGFHGSNQISTPNIDALAYNGIILNNHYTQQTCSPSRSALLTGRYPIHLGMQGFPLKNAEPNGLPLIQKILPQYLKDLGYTTSLIGKWHQGFFKKEYTPLERGFDSFFGYYPSGIGYYDFMSSYLFRGKYHYGFSLIRNATPVWDMAGSYSTDVFTTEATNVIRSHPTNKPLFLFLGYNAPHAAHDSSILEAPRDRINLFNYIIDPSRRIYAAIMSKLDDSVGEIINTLKQSGMLENSIILFMADNGSPSSPVSLSPNWGSNFPLRGTKETVWEGGVKSASFIWTKNFQQNPRVSRELIHISDWLPTLYTAAGGNLSDLPENLDGVNQWSSLVQNEPSRRRSALINIDEKNNYFSIVSIWPNGNKNQTWKLISGILLGGALDGIYADTESQQFRIYDYGNILQSNSFKAIEKLSLTSDKEIMQKLRESATVNCKLLHDLPRGPRCDDSPCLFNLEKDPCEQHNLAKENTNIVNNLLEKINEFKRTLVPQTNKPIDIKGSSSARLNKTVVPWIE